MVDFSLGRPTDSPASDHGQSNKWLLMCPLLFVACQTGTLSDKSNPPPAAAVDKGSAGDTRITTGDAPPTPGQDSAADLATLTDSTMPPDRTVAADRPVPPTPDAPRPPDSAPPPPPGTAVGDTAANFTISYCDSATFELHAQQGSYPAVVLLYSWVGFT